MREIGLRAIAALCEQEVDIADAALLDSYSISNLNILFYLAQRCKGAEIFLSFSASLHLCAKIICYLLVEDNYFTFD